MPHAFVAAVLGESRDPDDSIPARAGAGPARWPSRPRDIDPAALRARRCAFGPADAGDANRPSGRRRSVLARDRTASGAPTDRPATDDGRWPAPLARHPRDRPAPE